MAFQQTLPNGTVLDGIYVIGQLLGSGGFGKTYLVQDQQLNRLVAVKEYFPVEMAVRDGLTVRPHSESERASFASGLDRFVREARHLATVTHPNIVKIFRSFDANGTSYIVLEYIEGIDFEDWVSGLGRPPSQAELDRLAQPLLDALERVHAADILHRDVSPKNIRIRNRDGSPVLLDFGAAKSVTAVETRHTSTVIVAAGYAPPESYATQSKRQGPWTDIYGLAATFYRALSGSPPPISPDRVFQDPMVPAIKLPLAGSNFRPTFLQALDWGMTVDPGKRPQSVADWRGALLEGKTTGPVTARPAPTSPVSQPPTPTTAPPTGQQPPVSGPARPTTRPSAAQVAQAKRGFPFAAVLGGALVLGGGATLAAWKLNIAGLADMLNNGGESARVAEEARKKEEEAKRDAEQKAKIAAARDQEAKDKDAKDKEARDKAGRDKADADAKRKAEAEAKARAENDEKAKAEARKKENSWQTLAQGGDGPVTALAVQPDGRMASGLRSGALKLWRVSDPFKAEPIAFSGQSEADVVSQVALADDGSERAATVAQSKGSVNFWDPKAGSRQPHTDATRRWIQTLAFGDKTRQFMALSVVEGSNGRKLARLDRWAPDGKSAGQTMLDTGDRTVFAAAFAPGGEDFALATRALEGPAAPAALLVFKAGSERPAKQIEHRGFVVTRLAYSPANPRMLAVAGHTADVELWDVEDGKQINTLKFGGQAGRPGTDPQTTALAFSPDGQFLAAASSDGRITVWNTATGAVAISPDAPGDPVGWLAFLKVRTDRPVLLAPWDDGSIRRISVGAGS